VETLRLGGDEFRAELEIEEDFGDLSRWTALEDHGRWDVRGGGLVGEWLEASPSLFLSEPVEGDYLWTIRAGRVRPGADFLERFEASKHGRGTDPFCNYNFNFWLRADTPGVPGEAGGAGFLEEYPKRLGTGWNGMGDDHWRSLYATVVRTSDENWVRLRRSPGYVKVAEARDAIGQLDYDRAHEFAFALEGGRARMYFDGTRVFDYTDPDPHARGHIGLCVWLCVMRFERMRLYRFA